MSDRIVEKNGESYLLLSASGPQFASEADGTELISLCFEHGVSRILIPQGRLGEDFFNLKTRVAGLVVQKIANYRMKAAAVISQQDIKGRFAEFMLESNRGNVFRAFANTEEAEAWLLR